MTNTTQEQQTMNNGYGLMATIFFVVATIWCIVDLIARLV